MTEHVARSPKSCSASAAAAAATEAGTSPMAVSRRTRLPAWIAPTEHPVEQRPGGAVVERGADLAEDLALAGHERVEPRGHAIEVQCDVVVVQPVRDVRQLVDFQAGALREQRQSVRVVGPC